jgi:hypothetical protein
MTKLFLDGVLAGEQAQLGPVEAGTQELVDCILQILGVAEDANRFARRSGLFNRHLTFS